MPLDYHELDALRQSNPAWRLLASPHSPLIASFLSRAFVEGNARVVGEADLVEALEDVLFAPRDEFGPGSYPRSAVDYLNEWAEPAKGWLHKFYRHDSDAMIFEPTGGLVGRPWGPRTYAWYPAASPRACGRGCPRRSPSGRRCLKTAEKLLFHRQIPG